MAIEPTVVQHGVELREELVDCSTVFQQLVVLAAEDVLEPSEEKVELLGQQVTATEVLQNLLFDCSRTQQLGEHPIGKRILRQLASLVILVQQSIHQSLYEVEV